MRAWTHPLREPETTAVTLETLVSAKGLTVHYGSSAAIDSIDLSLTRGEILGVVGTNGAGKSTLMGVISGAVVPDAGSMTLAGESYTPESVDEARAAGVGYVPQRIEIDPDSTVADAIFRTSFRGSLDTEEKAREAGAIIEEFGVVMRPDDLIGSLVPAELATVELLRLACEETQVILLDEVSASFDDHEISLFHALAQRLAHDGRAVMHVSHRIDEVQALSDRVAVLRDGRLHSVLTPRTTTRAALIDEMFGETFAIQRRPVTAGGSDELMRLDSVSQGERLTDVTLSIRAGEVLGVTGLRRSGISELAELLAGDRTPSGGSVSLRGEGVTIGSEGAALEQGIAYIPERDADRDLNEDDSVTRSLVGDVGNQGLSFVGETKRLREVIATVQRFGIRTSGIHGEVGSLSGGDQQKVALARTLSRTAQVFVLNQPTRGIDERARQDVYALIDEVCALGSAVVLVSSDMSELVSRCHRVAIMREGELVDVYANEDLTEDTIMVLALGHNWFADENDRIH